MRNKKAQLDNPILTFAVLVIGLVILAPIVMKIFISVQAPVSVALGNVSTGGVTAQSNFDYVMTTAINFWDKVVIGAFFAGVLLLFVSAFFIDTHPAFVVLYIFTNFLIMLFIPSIMQAADNIYDSSTFVTETAYLTMMDAIRTHFVEILLGVMVITGIIIYAKINLAANSSSR